MFFLKSNKEIGKGKEWAISDRGMQIANMQMMLCSFLCQEEECKSKPQWDHSGNSLVWSKSKWLIIMAVIIERERRVSHFAGMNRNCFSQSKGKKILTELLKCKMSVPFDSDRNENKNSIEIHLLQISQTCKILKIRELPKKWKLLKKL